MNRVSLSFWLGLLGLALAAIGWQAWAPAAPAAHDDDDAPAAMLFRGGEVAWAAVELMNASGRERFERDASGQWFRHQAMAGEAADHGHRIDAAAAGRIGEVLRTFSRTRIDRRITASVTAAAEPRRLAAYGVDNPALIVQITERDGKTVHLFEAGHIGPDGLSRYVRLPRDGTVLMLANYQIEGLIGLMAPLPGVLPK